MRNTTICVNHREDSRLLWTIANIKRTCNPMPEIIVINDGDKSMVNGIMFDGVNARLIHTGGAKGTSFTRHTGIMAASNERIITMDSHIDFADGWLEKFEEGLDAHPDYIFCGKCRNVLMPENKEVGYHSGASLEILKDAKAPVAGKWRRVEEPTGVIPCIMGGCYGLNKSWYQKIGEPWKYGRGWGADEESLTIATRMFGGEAYCINIDITHVFQPRSSYAVTAKDCVNVEYNKARTLLMLPVSETETNKHMDIMIGASPHRSKVYKIIEETGIKKYAEWLKLNAVNFSIMEERNIMQNEQVIKPKTKKRGRPRKKETKPRTQNRMVVDGGTPCPHCGNPYDHRIQNTYPNGNRRVICGLKSKAGCAKPFIIVRRRKVL